MSGFNSRHSPPANNAFQDADGQPSQAWLNHHQQIADLASQAAPSANPVLTGSTTLDGGNGTEKLIKFTTGGVIRWDLGVAGNGEAANGGSDFILRRYADDGSLLSVVMTISRQLGQVQMTAPVIFVQPVGFNGAQPVGKRTAAGANTAALLNSVILGLQQLGLFA